MSLRERVKFLLQQTKLSQADFENRSGYSRAVMSNFLTGKTDKPRIDLLEAMKQVFPNLNLNWLITGKGDIWDGPAPNGLEHIKPPQSPTDSPNLELLNALLIQKLEAVARHLQQNDPEAYKQLRLDELIKRL